jgi:hypothetical protein
MKIFKKPFSGVGPMKEEEAVASVDALKRLLERGTLSPTAFYGPVRAQAHR